MLDNDVTIVILETLKLLVNDKIDDLVNKFNVVKVLEYQRLLKEINKCIEYLEKPNK